MSSNILYRKLSELESKSLAGIDIPDEYAVPAAIAQIFKGNPSNDRRVVPIQKLGVVDGRIGGAAYSFPTRVCVDGDVVKACSGGELSVKDWARRSGLGFELCDFDADSRDGDHVIFEGAGLSQIAVKVHRFMGFKVFEYPRYIMLLKSRALVERKFSGLVQRMLTGICDFAIVMYSLVIRSFYHLCKKGTSIEAIERDDVEKLAVVAQFTEDGSRFCEVHDRAWFTWIMNCSYSSERTVELYLVRQNDKPIGFFLLKKRFYEQASHRGFKNVNLGSIIEWGCEKGKESLLLWNVVNWVARKRRELDAVEFPVCEPFAQRFLKRLGWRQVGNANFCYNIRPNSGFTAPDGMDNVANWRLRPAMGDAGLS